MADSLKKIQDMKMKSQICLPQGSSLATRMYFLSLHDWILIRQMLEYVFPSNPHTGEYVSSGLQMGHMHSAVPSDSVLHIP